MGELRCEVTDFGGPARWRWVLTGPGGRFLGDHDVRLDETDWRYEAFTDLRSYLLWHTAPDRRMEQETRIVAEVGAWLGEQVFGPLGAVMVRERPATVRIVVPAQARTLAFRPFELAHVDGRPLALRNVTLVTQIGAGPRAAVKGVWERLRVLGLFSLPTGHRPLNLRRERQALSRLFQELAAVHGRAVDVRILQYGATRERLREILEEDEGWDVVHISGHGEPGELLLEHADGSADPIAAADLTDLLDLARERLSLVSLSSCWSGALTAAEQLRLLKLTPPPALADERSPAAPASERPAAALATELVDRLDCAVLAMRYPIIDDFAIDLAEKLYGLLAGKGQPLPRALGTALRKVVADPPTPACPPLSVATPALFGAHAVDLRLAAPPRTEPDSYDPWRLKLAGFPAQPERFVGRVGVMARSSGALAPRSGASGVLLHGMPGAGKTACALELAYTHEDAFERLIWFKAPDEGRDITDALTRFALALESALPGLRFAHLVDDVERLESFLPRLTELAERRRLLIVADNIESLLTGSGGWRDPRWRAVVAALTAHSGLSRLVLTSRRLPEDLDRRIRVEPIDALPLDEALLLARELPALNRLIEGTAEGIDADAAQRLAVRVLEAAQGHPKLLELADGQASDPDRLRELVATARDTWQRASVSPESFFRTGVADATGDDYLHALGAWTRTLLGGLPPGEGDLFLVLCCLEERDRTESLLEALWDSLWAALNRRGERPEPRAALARMSRQGLITTIFDGRTPEPRYVIHPGVAGAGREEAGEYVQQAVDSLSAFFWTGIAYRGMKNEATTPSGGLVIRAGLSALPYLMRTEQWAAARALLGEVFNRDHSSETMAIGLPILREIAARVAGTAEEPLAIGLLAATFDFIDPDAAEQRLRGVAEGALATGNHRLAAAATLHLAEHCKRSGRLDEGLRFADQAIEEVRQAELGPWTRLMGELLRLDILLAMGQAQLVHRDWLRLHHEMSALPEESGDAELAVPWSCRERLFDIGRRMFGALQSWKDALRSNAAAVDSMRRRGASAHDITQIELYSCFYLIELGRLEDARQNLLRCRDVFEEVDDLLGLAGALDDLAHVESARGLVTVAVGLERDALRYAYSIGRVENIAVYHANLALYLRRCGEPESLLHLLTGALIERVTGRNSRHSMRRLVAALRESATAPPPTSLGDLCRQVTELSGVDPKPLLDGLTSGPPAAEDAYRQLLSTVLSDRAVRRFVIEWDPVIAALAAEADGDREAAAALDKGVLADPQEDVARHELIPALTRIRAGERGPEVLAGLDPIDTAIAHRAMAALDRTLVVPVALWRADWLVTLLGEAVAAGLGDPAAALAAGRALAVLRKTPDKVALANALDRILEGERDPAPAASLADPVDRAVVATVLHHLNADEPEDE